MTARMQQAKLDIVTHTDTHFQNTTEELQKFNDQHNESAKHMQQLVTQGDKMSVESTTRVSGFLPGASNPRWSRSSTKSSAMWTSTTGQ